MKNDDEQDEVVRLLREIANDQDKALPPKPVGDFERSLILKEVQRTLRKTTPTKSFWTLWQTRLWRRVTIGLAAATAAVLIFVQTGHWQHGNETELLAFQWPSQTPFNVSGSAVWRSPQSMLARGLPDFETGLLGASADDPRTGWRLATVIVRTEGGFGSGAVISGDGWILSNYHVVADAAQAVAVDGRVPEVDVILGQLVDGRVKRRGPAFRAKVFRVDPRHDLALLKLDKLPDGVSQLSYFRIADEVKDGDACFVIGSQGNGPAWLLRSGNVFQEFDFPQDLSQNVAGVSSEKANVERTRARVLASNTQISPGDSGGPLLNTKGELIGLTFATPNNDSAGAAGWHIALQELKPFISRLPEQPEAVPFDPWTAGFPEARVLRPQLATTEGARRINSLQYQYVGVDESESGNTSERPLAVSIFIDFQQHELVTSEEALNVPVGLWGMEDQGKFRFDLFVTIRADGVIAAGYANHEGIVDEIRIGQTREDAARLIWRRQLNGLWQGFKPDGGVPLLDSKRIGAENFLQLRTVMGKFLTPSAGG